ncbi:hypothetical protein TNCV_3076021 [Trichonephila clavipes]|nr:hypothetical protein TNCV_3076021 [Trichonephila clavipes]
MQISQEEDARGEWENLPPKTEKVRYQKGELVATRALARRPPAREKGIQRAEVDDPGLKKDRRERWPSRDPPTRCSQERRAGHSQHYRED